jgi:hypothetical protein
MSDDKSKKGGQDRSRINTSEDYEVRYWADKFGVSAEELREAVRASGSNDPEEVEANLKNRR